ncbi:MAG TPA: phosphoribosylglycinamide formyltransferase [Acidobacteriota bacterium]|nr:phosphoribosylglycinamide formyltransferase [Acidobacteriota bacterium]
MKGRIAVLISGRGSNMQSIVVAAKRGVIQADVSLVVSNRSNAPGLDFARRENIETVIVPHKDYPDREDYDRKIVEILEERKIDLVCLAGFMRLLSPVFVKAFPNRIMNIHPALLPSFPGLHAQKQAVEYGVKITGCTVHFVDEGLDSGPIILQKIVEVMPKDTEETLSERLLPIEHSTYVEAVRLFFEKRLHIEGRKVLITSD